MGLPAHTSGSCGRRRAARGNPSRGLERMRRLMAEGLRSTRPHKPLHRTPPAAPPSPVSSRLFGG